MRNNFFSSVEILHVDAPSLPFYSLNSFNATLVSVRFVCISTIIRMMSWDFPYDLLKACVAMTATKHVFDKVELILRSSVNMYELIYLSDETKDEDGECNTSIHSMVIFTQHYLLLLLLLLLFRDGHRWDLRC